MPAGTDPQDIFQNGQWYSRAGTPVTQSVLAQSALPVAIPSSSATGIQANGTVTLDTAFPVTYASIWCYFPAGAVSGDATGGFYYCVFTSATAGTVYAGKQGTTGGATTAFTPSIPATLTPVTGSGAGYTQTTGSEIAMCNVPVPGGSMGPNGVLMVTHVVSFAPVANTKLFRTRLGGTAIAGLSFASTDGGATFGAIIQNRGSQSVQMENNAAGLYLPYSRGSNATQQFNINTAVTQPLTLVNQIGVASDYAVMDAFSIKLTPG